MDSSATAAFWAAIVQSITLIMKGSKWLIVMVSTSRAVEIAGGNWLDIKLAGSGGVNRMGLGAKIRVYPVDKSTPQDLLCEREMAIGYGYCSGQEAIAHFGLGDLQAVDLEIILPHGRGVVHKPNVTANQRLTVDVKP